MTVTMPLVNCNLCNCKYYYWQISEKSKRTNVNSMKRKFVLYLKFSKQTPDLNLGSLCFGGEGDLDLDLDDDPDLSLFTVL